MADDSTDGRKKWDSAALQQVELSDGQELTVRLTVADRSAPWVVFSNSLATDLSIWDAQVVALEGRFNVLRYDQRGHGGSAIPTRPVDFRVLGGDVVELLDCIGIDRAAYVGLSIGVPTGLAAVAQAPARFTGLMLVDGQAKTASGGREQWQERIAVVRRGGIAAFAKGTAARWLANPQSPVVDRLEAMIAATPMEGFIACAQALSDFDVSAGLGSIACPVLLVAGERDGNLPETMRNLSGMIPNGRFESVPDAGHVPCFERPDAFNAVMSSFLRGLS